MTDTESSEQPVLYEVDGNVATITLNRPHRLNAISTEMLDRLGVLLAQADDDPGVWVIVLTGAGKGFCSGLDLVDASAGTGIGSGSKSGGAPPLPSTRNLPTNILFNIDTPVICALNGAAAGYGLDLALGCDIRLAAASAKIAPGFAKRGVVPESGGTWYLPRLIGHAKAAEIGFLGRTLSAEEAADYGLVNKVVPDDELAGLVAEWAAEIAGNAPLAIQSMKRLFRHAWTEDFEAHSHHVLLQVMRLFQSHDFREGVASYMEKRPPVFENR